MPFILSGSIATLTSLDFLGFGLPPGSPSLGEMVAQGKANLQAPWLGISAFLTLSIQLSLFLWGGQYEMLLILERFFNEKRNHNERFKYKF